MNLFCHRIMYLSAEAFFFCYRKIGHNFRFYCIFVEYNVFWHWQGILECGNYNIVRSMGNALYFNSFTGLLTSQNKFKQLH